MSNQNYSDIDYWNMMWDMENVQRVTLKLKPIYWVQQEFKNLFEIDFCKYCDKRGIDYVLVAEYGEHGNYHWHGLIIFPFEHIRKKFLSWFRKYFGFVYFSEKGTAQGWFNYVFKGCPMPVYGELQKPPLYLFDPKYEPT